MLIPYWVVIPIAVLLLVFVVPLWNRKGPWYYYSRYVIYIGLTSLIGLLAIPIFCISPCNVKNSRYIAFILKHQTKLLGIAWELRGGEVLAEDNGAVIVSNHQSMLDILGMFNIWPVMHKCATVAKKEVFYVWPFGLAAWLAGVVYIDRGNSEKAHNQLNYAATLMKSQKVKLWIFPEGTRNSKWEKLLPFKKGAFRIAISCQVPLIPVLISPYYFIDHENKVFGSGNMIIKALPRISTEGLTLDDLDDLIRTTQRMMEAEYELLRKEIEFNYESIATK